jgi:SAM-dependent methyltransferase
MRDDVVIPPVDHDRSRFWTEYQPGFRVSDHPVGSPEFFAEVEAQRYALEPAIREMARFDDWAGKDVLEAGCGIGTDGLCFARAGARYTGIDFSPTAIEIAQERFAAAGHEGRFVRGTIAEQPFADGSFDLVYSNGVIHHLPETERVVREFHRVLRPGGRAIVMVYHRTSLNHHVSIMLVRRALAALLLLPGVGRVAARVTGEDPAVLEGHRELLREHGLRYLRDRELFLSNNTDGPGNPLSKVYSRADARELFAPFQAVDTSVRFLNLRAYPGGERIGTTRPAEALGRRIGWHLWIEARKSA